MEGNKEDIEEEICWICKRRFVNALEEFNKKVLSNIYVDDNIKSRYEKGKKEFFPFTTDKFVEFLTADVKGDRYSMSGKVVGDVFIWLCPVCSGLLESLSSNIDMENIVTKEDLEDVSISIKSTTPA
jgi:hypothetical protein